MNQKRRVLAIIIGSLILLIMVLLILKPIILRTFNKTNQKEINDPAFSREVDPLLNENDIILGINPIYSDKGITWGNNILTLAEDGTYNLTGNLPLGQIVITAPKQIILNLTNVNIFNNMEAAIDIKTTGNVILQVNGENTLTSDGSLGINSKGHLVIEGQGDINITSNGDGIKASDVTIANNKTYIMTKNSVFADHTSFTITNGELIGMGTNCLGQMSTQTKQKVLIFNLPTKLNGDEELSLQTLDATFVMTFSGYTDANSIILSRADLLNTDYILSKNNEKMTIGEKDTFNVGDGLNIFN